MKGFCLCDHPETAHVQGKRCQGTVYDVVGNYSCHCVEYIENAVCVCGKEREAHRYRYDQEPSGTHSGSCQKFVPVEQYIQILEKPVLIQAPLDAINVEQDPTSIRFSLLELD